MSKPIKTWASMTLEDFFDEVEKVYPGQCWDENGEPIDKELLSALMLRYGTKALLDELVDRTCAEFLAGEGRLH